MRNNRVRGSSGDSLGSMPGCRGSMDFVTWILTTRKKFRNGNQPVEFSWIPTLIHQRTELIGETTAPKLGVGNVSG